MRFPLTPAAGKGDQVREVTPRRPRLEDADLERCMMAALRTMADAGYSPDPDDLISRGGLLPARGVLANVSVLPEVIRLIPVVVTGSGVTIVVVVAVLVVAAAVSIPKQKKPTKAQCDKEWEEARKQCRGQLKIPGPKSRWGITGGYTDVEECARGLVSEPCKGNDVDHGRPGRRY